MYIDTFFSKCAFREEWTVFLRVDEWTFLISIVAVGPVPASDFLLVFQIGLIIFVLLRFLHSYIVLMLTQINNRIGRIDFNFLHYRLIWPFLEGLLSLLIPTFRISIVSSFICSSLFADSIKYVTLLSFGTFALISFIQLYDFLFSFLLRS